MTITGSSFGAAQGSGQVWLGTSPGIVQSWNDTQIVARVADDSDSGNLQVLQNGNMSQPIPFTVNKLHIGDISPTSGASGTSVTITGTSFESSQGTGTVILGSAAGHVVTWSDTQVVATVDASSVSGVARIQQNGQWSNAKTFTVLGGNITLVPNVLNLVVGDTHTIKAVNAAGQAVTGLTWTTTDSAIVSLSTDDPPVLTALAIGHVTIKAGSASADVTVSAIPPSGTLPTGTVLWSNPAPADRIVPAVPSPTGVADVFAITDSGMISAITADGQTAWTASVGDGTRWWVPDFQGGMVGPDSTGSSLLKLDGLTGQPTTLYSAGSGVPVIPHPDGTIFLLKGDSVVGVNSTGGVKFTVPLPQIPSDAFLCSALDSPIIAGDGYYYVSYAWQHYLISPLAHLGLLRVDTTGAATDITVAEWPAWLGEVCGIGGHMITNSDQGIVAVFGGGSDASPARMALVNGTSVSIVNAPTTPGIYGPDAAAPVLQAQDGSFIGSTANYMVAFDQSGNVRWTVPNEEPAIATDEGGVMGKSGTIYDQNGTATARLAGLPIFSWTGNAYQPGPVEQVADNSLHSLFDLASTFWAVDGGNYSHNAAGVALVRTFADNEENQDIIVANPSQSEPNQQTITNVLNDILQALNSGNYAGCSAWLTGSAPSSISTSISNLITYSAYGHGSFNDHTAAFVGGRNQGGTLTGVPGSFAITVNDTGAFFNAKLGDKTFTVGPNDYKGGTLKAQAFILTHELGHMMKDFGGATGFQSDAGSKKAGRSNDKLVKKYCGKLIGSLK